MAVTHILLAKIVTGSKLYSVKVVLWEHVPVPTHTHITYIRSAKELIAVHLFPTKFIGFPRRCHPSCQGSQANCISQAFLFAFELEIWRGSGFCWVWGGRENVRSRCMSGLWGQTVGPCSAVCQCSASVDGLIRSTSRLKSSQNILVNWTHWLWEWACVDDFYSASEHSWRNSVNFPSLNF